MNDYLKRNPLLHLCITEPLRRGTARVLNENECGALVYEPTADLYFLAAENIHSAEELLSSARNVQFIMLCNADFAPLISRFHIQNEMRCLQAAYLKPEPPEPDARLRIEAPDEAAFARILENYHMDTPEELRRRATAGELFFARDLHGEDVGFVGIHPEGCFGMLEVFPQQRGKGYGAALERHIIRFQMQRGRVPYCQVRIGNEISMNLQRSVGLEFAPEVMLMAWNK